MMILELLVGALAWTAPQDPGSTPQEPPVQEAPAEGQGSAKPAETGAQEPEEGAAQTQVEGAGPGGEAGEPVPQEPPSQPLPAQDPAPEAGATGNLGVPEAEAWSPEDEGLPQEGPAPTSDGPAPLVPFVDGAGPIAPGAVRQAQFLNAVQMIVNEECITATDVFAEARRARSEEPRTREETARLLQEMAGELTKRLLKEQAGRDLGYDAAMVEALVRDELNSRRERAGSVTEMARQLELYDIDSAELREVTRKRIYMTLWEGAVSGSNAGAEGRQYVDRYVRPGQLRQEYLRLGRGLELPATILLEEMLIVPDRDEPLEAARQRAEIVHRRLGKGEDFFELNAVFGIPGRSPELTPIEESKLAVVPEIKAFVDTAEEGEISPVLPVVIQGQPAGFRILRFVRREEAQAQAFVDREFQDRLAQEIQARRSAYNVDRALLDLLDAAYVWPSDSVSKPRAAADE